MATSTTKQWGVSPPISIALPDPIDNQMNDELVEELKRENNYETQEGADKRIETLNLLNRVTEEFVREVSRKKRYPPSQINQFGGKIFPYGSFRLKVYGPGSDIDALAVAPQHVTRDDFFDTYEIVLRRMAGPGAVSQSTPVTQSFVPIIKMVLNGIEIDLIFASIVSLKTIPKNLSLNDNDLLIGMDDKSVRAITGPRVTDEILASIPLEKSFRHALRAIKLWAQRRAIYANIVGFPGGVAWAMLVARVCQLYPHAVGATIVDKFFFVIKNWNWPTPVLLKDIEYPKNPEKFGNVNPPWNPAVNKRDKGCMPIITPAYPSMSATYNITESSKTIILRELARAGEITNRIFSGKAQWSELFKKHTFFTSDHKYYLSIIASSMNPDSAKAWAGTVESKVRHFISNLERIKDIELARPFTKGFKRMHKCEDSAQIREVQKGTMKYKVDETTTVENTAPDLVTADGDGEGEGEGNTVPVVKDSGAEADKDSHTVYTYTFYVGIDTTAKGSLNLVPAFQNFKEKCETTWVDFRRDTHHLALASSRSWDLPEDLFDQKAGEVRPSKPVKKAPKAPKTSKVETKPVRRSINEVEDAETNGHSVKRQRLMTPTNPTPAAAAAI